MCSKASQPKGVSPDRTNSPTPNVSHNITPEAKKNFNLTKFSSQISSIFTGYGKDIKSMISGDAMKQCEADARFDGSEL